MRPSSSTGSHLFLKLLLNIWCTMVDTDKELYMHGVTCVKPEWLVECVQAFAFALLDGKVLRCLRPVREFMAERPRTVIMPEAADRERVQNLLVKLEEKKIISLAMLRELWKENPNELYPEIRNWFQKSFQKNFKDIWSNMLNEARVKYN
ncbi:hypothetical protein M0R45_016625 [Rubus argutus]|uniref:ATP-dependent RNA helicase DHX37-like C-terminal domain-containing protein n=1 Tax=Rubus argutus TaxID=59490 RepID=A0AAW1XSH7_RUBAR